MAETETPDFESRLGALEKTIAELRAMLELRTRSLAEIREDGVATKAATGKVVLMLEEVLPLVRKAAPLLDSPLARMANSPAAGVMGLFTGGRRG